MNPFQLVPYELVMMLGFAFPCVWSLIGKE